jgi:hypothetical protein
MAVIREQAEHHRTATAEHFAEWQKLSSELASTTPVPGLDPQIQTVILDHRVASSGTACRVEGESRWNRAWKDTIALPGCASAAWMSTQCLAS